MGSGWGGAAAPGLAHLGDEHGTARLAQQRKGVDPLNLLVQQRSERALVGRRERLAQRGREPLVSPAHGGVEEARMALQQGVPCNGLQPLGVHLGVAVELRLAALARVERRLQHDAHEQQRCAQRVPARVMRVLEEFVED